MADLRGTINALRLAATFAHDAQQYELEVRLRDMHRQLDQACVTWRAQQRTPASACAAS
jgi:hypothetical protein